jgi:hypothetical protein
MDPGNVILLCCLRDFGDKAREALISSGRPFARAHQDVNGMCGRLAWQELRVKPVGVEAIENYLAVSCCIPSKWVKATRHAPPLVTTHGVRCPLLLTEQLKFCNQTTRLQPEWTYKRVLPGLRPHSPPYQVPPGATQPLTTVAILTTAMGQT